MSRKGNFEYNYPKVIKYLNSHDIPFQEYSNGQHLKIWADTHFIELWPSRMTYHYIASEDVLTSSQAGYKRLSFYFSEKEFKKLLEGEL